jgi:hypothetical protein
MMTPTSGEAEEVATREGAGVWCGNGSARKIASDGHDATGVSRDVASESTAGEIETKEMRPQHTREDQRR